MTASSTAFHIGLDLAWADKENGKSNESGIVMLGPTGRVEAAGWCVGVEEAIHWLERHAPQDARLFVDAPLVVENATGQRLCEKQVGQRYWPWKVSANSTNTKSRHLAGVELLAELVARGWSYHDGVGGPAADPGRFVSECYPYTTIAGARELCYVTERPCYKRPPKGMSMAEFRPLRNAACDELVRRVGCLKDADPPMDLHTHPDTRRLVNEKSPDKRKDYKHREDLLDAAVCAWTAALWSRWGETRCQVLGEHDEAPQLAENVGTVSVEGSDAQFLDERPRRRRIVGDYVGNALNARWQRLPGCDSAGTPRPLLGVGGCDQGQPRDRGRQECVRDSSRGARGSGHAPSPAEGLQPS